MNDCTRQGLRLVSMSPRNQVRSHTQRALVAGKLALGASAVVRVAADTTNIVVGHIPAPRGDGVPLPDRDLHDCLSLLPAVVGRQRVGRKQTAAFVWQNTPWSRRSRRRRVARPLRSRTDWLELLHSSPTNTMPTSDDDSWAKDR